MQNAAMKAAKGIVRDFGELEKLQVSKKGVANFVSEADRRAEKVLHRELSHARPDYCFLMEEGGAQGNPDAEFRWIIDPIDGTHNYINAVPYFCISIGLERRYPNRSEIVAGLVYDPIQREMFVAEKHAGAYLNDRRIHVSARSDLEGALISTASIKHSIDSKPKNYQMVESLGKAHCGIRITGATALDLAYIAAGRYDGFWCTYFKPWDVAAGLLLVTEAGGRISQIGVDDHPLKGDTLLATNANIYNKVNARLKGE